MKNCIFCKIEKLRIVDKTKFFYVIRDLYPVTYLHTLIIPTRHIETYFDLNPEELYELSDIIKEHRNRIIKLDESVTAFNIGVNSGEDAGQTVMHCHVHLIPRRKGDVKNPRGGIRGVIPEKQNY